MNRIFSAGVAAVAISVVGTIAPANAQAFSGTGDPASNAAFAAGSQQATFTTADQSFASYTETGVTLGPGRIDSQYANNFNSTGSYYDNDAGGLNVIDFSFSSPTSAFAFNWGAADVVWTMDVFAGMSTLASYALTPTFGSNNKEYFGFSGANITSVRLTASSRGDWVFIDNLTFGGAGGAVPEPASWAMLIAGFGIVGASMRRRRANVVAA